MNDTIYALATGSLRSAVAIIRLSGPQTDEALRTIGAGAPPPRRASLRALRDPVAGALLDEALVLRFPAPASFTGEDCAELHLHGGRAVIDGVAKALEALGLRPADPGEFTRRAFEHGKLDLLQAEAVADLVDAESEAQRRQALEHLDGGLSGRVEGWRETLLQALVHLEVEMDFPDEDLPPDVAERARAPLSALADDFSSALADHRSEQVRDGFRVALVGAPNVGKSSLFNALLRRDAAIVTPIAGTTRDVIEARLVLEGRLILLADTAGDRTTDDPIEREGVRRARAWAEGADLRLRLVEAADPNDPQARPGEIIVRTKADLAPRTPDALAVSATTGAGLQALQDAVLARAAGAGPRTAGLARPRHRAAVAAALGHVRNALDDWAAPAELRSEGLRLALGALEEMTGRNHVEDVLDRLFSGFCIGK